MLPTDPSNESFGNQRKEIGFYIKISFNKLP